MPSCSEVAIRQITTKPTQIKKKCMAKSEIPSLVVVQCGGGNTANCCNMDQQQQQQCLSTRPSRLEKQEEFEEEEEPIVYMPSPVTIQIEDRGSGPEEGGEEGSRAEDCAIRNGAELDTGKSDGMDNTRQTKMPSQRVKLLVRSQAVHDDSSPPPDLETVITNTNMLSVTSAPAFATQSQSKSSNRNRLGRSQGGGSQGSSQGSQGSTESSSGLSRDSSTETCYTDPSGIDLQQFIIDTLHKNQKDRITLLKIEQDLITLVKDPKRHSWKFAQMSSYNRMLVHRVAAFFGLDHYVDAIGSAVIVNKTKNTRIPDSRFQDHFRDELLPEEPKKSILKRDSISFEENKEQKSPERQSSTDSRRSKSFEEREEEYEKARARIFNQDEGLGESPISHRSSQEDIRWPSSDTRPWSSTDSDSSGRPLGAKAGSSFETEGASIVKGDRSVAVLSKAESEGKELLYPARLVRPVMTKASSFGGISVLTREGSAGRNVTPKITKAESFNVATLSSSVVAIPTTPSPSLLVSSSVAMQTSCPSHFVATNTQQTFPIVAGQPTLHIPIQQFSSQVSGWSVGNRDVPVSQVSGGQQFPKWPVSSAPDVMFPGGVVINPQTGNQFVNMDNVMYRYKLPSNANSQTIMLTPYQPIAVQPPNQVPISSHISVVSPQTQLPTAPQAAPQNLQLSLNAQPQQQSQSQQQQQQAAIQIPQPPTVVYVPYITSPMVQQSSQQSNQQAQHQTQLIADQRAYAVNPSSGSVEELCPPMAGLSLIPQQLVQQPQEPQPAARNVVGVDPPQNYVTFKSQGSVNQQGTVGSIPVYYMPQVQQASNVHPVRYVFPANAPVAQQVAQVPNSQIITDVQAHVVTQATSQISGRGEHSKCSHAIQLQGLQTSNLARPGNSLICQRGVPLMQSDMCLIGHPLQHHFNPLLFSQHQQHPIARFIHPQSATSTTRPPKNRSKRTKGSSNGSRNGAGLLPHPDVSAGHILEIEGLPDGMKRSEIERYLEAATCHGAKIQFVDAESGNIFSNESDFVVCSIRHVVLAVFESETAAQSALLGIKTPKFQLRPIRRSTKEMSQKFS